MELNYIDEHTSCMNYKSRKYSGFSLVRFVKGETFDNYNEEIKANHLVFVLSGEIRILKDESCPITIRAGELAFVPPAAHYICTVIQDGFMISLNFCYNDISLCDKHLLNSYLSKKSQVDLCFETLPVREPLGLFLQLLEVYIQAGVNCKHLHELKERELFIIFRTAYTKEEMIRLFHPIMGVRVEFKIAVLQHKDEVHCPKELARLLGMSDSDLKRKFKQEFGESVHTWLQKQKNQKILTQLSSATTSNKMIIAEFGFSSAASFTRYCKNNFGYTPTELRSQRKE